MCKKVQYICALYSLIGHKEGKCGIQLYGFVYFIVLLWMKRCDLEINAPTGGFVFCM